MRIVVTGGSGFIGSHVVDALIENGHEVTVLDNAVRRLNSRAEYVAADILDTDAVAAVLRGSDAVFHLAGVSNADQAREHPAETFRINVEGTAAVCAAAVRAGAVRVIQASSVWVHDVAAGDPAAPVGAGTPFDFGRAGHVYTASKVCAELTVRSFAASYDLPWTILRYGIPYGPRMRDELVLARFVHQALNDEPLTLAGGGTQTRNFLFVEDLARAHVAALTTDAVNRVIVVDGAEPIAIRDLAALVLELTGSRSRIRRIPGRAGDYQSRPAATEPLPISWRPTTPLRDGVLAYVRWLRDVADEDERIVAHGV